MMRCGLLRPFLPCVAASLIAACSLAACSGTSQSGLPASAGVASAGGFEQARMDASGCSKTVVYVTSYNNSVYIYNQKGNGGTPCGQITGLLNPQGIFVDSKRNLWVAMQGNCRTVFQSVLEFAPGTSTPVKTLSDPNAFPSGVAVDNKTGTVYVANFFTGSNCESGSPADVAVYADGSTTPTSTLTDPNMAYAFSDALDHAGNLYVTYSKGYAGGGILEWTHGSGSAQDLSIALQYPAGIQTTKNGALLVCDQAAGCGDFEPGSTTMTKTFATGTPGAYGIALDKHEKNAWVENPSLSSGQLQQYKYPGPDKQAKHAMTVSGGGYAGVALSPASPQGRPY